MRLGTVQALAQQPRLHRRGAARAPRRENMQLSVQLDDLAGADLPINIPGTHTEYPNWRRKLPLETTAIFDSTMATRMMQALREARGE
jgi:4-alpha-glucanotransferase